MGYMENGPGPVRPAQGVLTVVRPGFSLERAFLTSFFGQNILKEA
jgi:hypothetical protein